MQSHCRLVNQSFSLCSDTSKFKWPNSSWGTSLRKGSLSKTQKEVQTQSMNHRILILTFGFTQNQNFSFYVEFFIRLSNFWTVWPVLCIVKYVITTVDTSQLHFSAIQQLLLNPWSTAKEQVWVFTFIIKSWVSTLILAWTADYFK